MVEAVVDAIDDGAVGEDRGEAAPAGFDQFGLAADVEIALVLTGKARRRQILGGRRAAHGDGDTGAVLLFERAIGTRDLLAQPRAAGRLVDDPASRCGPLG